MNPTVAHTPQKNGIDEHLHRTVVARVRKTLTVSKLPLAKYWKTFLLDTTSKHKISHRREIDDIHGTLEQK